jgi:hypothetical protein
MFEKFGALIQEMQERQFEVVRSRGSLALQQTQRNTAKSELMEAFLDGLRQVGDEYGFEVYETAEGVIMEVKNDFVMNRVKRMKDQNEQDIIGFISIEHNLKIKNLDYDAELEEELFLQEKEIAEQKAQQKEVQKRAKIQSDAELRAGKARLREQKIEQLLKDGEKDE